MIIKKNKCENNKITAEALENLDLSQELNLCLSKENDSSFIDEKRKSIQLLSPIMKLTFHSMILLMTKSLNSLINKRKANLKFGPTKKLICLVFSR